MPRLTSAVTGETHAAHTVQAFIFETTETNMARWKRWWRFANVEQFLTPGGSWDAFCASVATLPLDETSTFIYSGRGRPGSNGNFGVYGGLQTAIRPMLNEAKTCAAAKAQ